MTKTQRVQTAGTQNQNPAGPACPAVSSKRSAGWLAAIAVTPLLLACGPAMEEDLAAGEPVASASAEEAFPGRSGEVHTALLETAEGTDSVSYQLIDGYMVLEGDIILGRADGQFTAQSATLKTATWQGCEIPYQISASLPNQKRVTDAIKHWQDKTAVKFVKRTTQKDYVVFEDLNKGCWSWIGRVGGRQSVSLADNCSSGSAIHEIGHAVGLFHEQSRQDRDSYITILWDNIQSGKESNFDKYNTSSGRDVGKFDFGSIMLYGSDSFSRNKKPTLVRKDGSQWNAQRSALSQGDLGGAAKLCGS